MGYQEHFLTDDDITATPEKEVDEGFVGTGLVVSETGEIAIVHADGAMDEWYAYRVTYDEAMQLRALLGALTE